MFRDGVEILLNCLMDAISHPTRSNVRDMAARSLREFLMWAIKQTTPEEMAASPVNIKKLIEKLKLFSFDSSQHKRFGAALAFNNLYRVLREEEAIINIYWLDLLHTFAINFFTCEEFGMQNNTPTDLSQVSASLDHIARVMIERRSVFNSHYRDRVQPTAFPGPLLSDAVLWIFQQCGSRQMKYRQKSIELFNRLVACIDTHSSAGAFLNDTQTLDSIIELCEGHPDKIGLRARPTLAHVKNSKSPFTLIHTWLEHFLTTLDCYIWLVGGGPVQNPKELLDRSVIFQAINYFLDNVLFPTMAELLSNIDPDLLENSEATYHLEYGLEKMEKIRLIKCTILVRIFDFVIKLLPTCHEHFPEAFWRSNENLMKALKCCLFDPMSLGFDMKNQDVTRTLPQKIESTIVNINRHAPEHFAKDLQQDLSKVTSTHYKQLTDVSQAILSCSAVDIGNFYTARGIEIVFRLAENFNHSKHLKQFLDINAARTLYSLFDGVKEQSANGLNAIKGAPDTIEFSNKLMKISLNKENIHVELIDLLLNSTELKTSAMEDAQSTQQGKHFLGLHKVTIFEYFIKSVEVVVSRLVGRITAQNFLFVLRIFIDFTDFVYRNKQNDKAQMKSIANALLRHWQLIVLRSDELQGMTITQSLIELMGNIAMIYPGIIFCFLTIKCYLHPKCMALFHYIILITSFCYLINNIFFRYLQVPSQKLQKKLTDSRNGY